jgi:8-amino-7-oxononanoate synthase
MDSFEADLIMLEKKGLLRQLSTPHGADFASNDYLGYSAKLEIHKSLLNFLKYNFKIGSTGSRLISGNSCHTEDVENFLSKCFDVESTLIFGSGYLANMGVCVAMGGLETEFFSDERNHASIIDGIKISKSKVGIFAHNDLDQLDELLFKSRSRRKVIITESIFSMDGDLAPIPQLIQIADKYGAYLVVDEAHSTGTCGARNLGVMTQFEFNPLKTVIIHTCGKALGAYGAFVCCSTVFKKLLLNKARSQIFSTALPPIAVEHIRLSISCLISDSKSVDQLNRNIRYSEYVFRKFDLKHSGTHIVPIILGSNDAVLKGADQLSEVGIFVKAIRSPTVAVGSERIRLTIKSTHDLSYLDQICETLRKIKYESICHRN